MSNTELLIRKRLTECEECGGSNNILMPHKETCSKWRHIVDDHYDSACARGRCKHCNPEYSPPVHWTLTQEEAKYLKPILEEFRRKKG